MLSKDQSKMLEDQSDQEVHSMKANQKHGNGRKSTDLKDDKDHVPATNRRLDANHKK